MIEQDLTRTIATGNVAAFALQDFDYFLQNVFPLFGI